MTSMPPPQAPDDEHDAWLREALRHAPDADAAPPAALSALILREAQIKLRRPAPAPARSVWTRLWIWSARPAVGAGLASVMLAGVIAGMWWDRPMHENSPRAATEPVRAEAPAPQREATATAAAPATPEASTRMSAADRPAESQPGSAVPDPATATAPDRVGPSRPRATDALSKAARTLDTMAPAAPPAPMVTPSAAPPFAASGDAAAGRAAAAAPAPRAAGELRQRASPATAEQAFSDLRITLAADPAAWSWQRGDGPAQPIGDALNAWLADIDTLAAGRWSAGAGSAADAAWRPLQLMHRGQVVHRLGFDGALLRWDSAGAAGRAWQAPIEDAQADRLRRALERFAP
ncbi:hypothetical protein BURC_00550 [Burkholderiaceae bacterium]|nr:hypothetical protein BURC_00550 [Burkholderiaceae bacterium]